MPKTEDKNDDELAIRFSSNLLGLIAAKVRNHNKANADKKVSSKQLKEVFINAAENYDYAGYTRAQWSLARINMFLRIVSGEIPDLIQGREYTSLGGLTFESKVIIKEKEYDISQNWIPSPKDFNLAGEEIKAHDLCYNFNSIGELYLNEYQPIGLSFEL